MQNTPATSSTAPRIRQAVRTANAKTAPPALPRAPLLHGLNRAVLWPLAASGTGLLLSAGQVSGGAAPFGLGLLLGCGNTYAPAAALGCLAGLLLFQPLDTALKLAGACIGALTARIVGRQLGQTGFLPGAACGVGVLLLEQGLVTMVGGASPADTASLLCSAALAVLGGWTAYEAGQPEPVRTKVVKRTVVRERVRTVTSCPTPAPPTAQGQAPAATTEPETDAAPQSQPAQSTDSQSQSQSTDTDSGTHVNRQNQTQEGESDVSGAEESQAGQ